MSDQPTKLEILARLGVEFLEKRRRGKCPVVDDYTAQYPEFADEIREFVASLDAADQPVPGASDSALSSGGAAVSPSCSDETVGELVPKQIGDFRIIRQIGRGGMGIVYLAEQVSLGRHVALKVLPQQLVLDRHQQRRFEREARAAAKLHHTNIVPVFGVGECAGLHYYVMQFIEGLGLDEVLINLQQHGRPNGSGDGSTPAPVRVSRKDLPISDVAFVLSSEDSRSRSVVSMIDGVFSHQDDLTVDTAAQNATSVNRNLGASSTAGRLSDSFALSDGSVIEPTTQGKAPTSEHLPRNYWHSVADIGVQVASALQYAHEQGVIHRDVKPSNLLLDTVGTVWVLDFGLAKASDQRDLTNTGSLLGTLRYMPPEAFEGKADGRSDTYSLGLTLYELLALQPAFGETASNRLIKQVHEHAPTRLDKLDPHIPRDLATIVHKAIDREPDCRYQTSKALADDLKRYLNDEPIKARRTSALEHVHRWARRNRPLATSLALIALLLVTINIAGPVLTLRLKNAYDAEVVALGQAKLSEQKAVGLLGLAQKKEREAIESLQLVQVREQALNRTLYRAEMNLAGQAAAEQTGIQRVRDLTSAWRPAEDEADLRDWEWYYLHGLGRLAEETLAVDGRNAVAIAWSPCGRLIAYGLDNGTMVIRNLRSATTVLRQKFHYGHVLDVAWSTDGTQIASLAQQDKYVRVWDPLTGREYHRFELPGVNDWSGSVAFSQDGRLLAADSRDHVVVWDLHTGEQLQLFDMVQVAHVAWSPVDNHLAASSKQQKIAVWDGASGELLGSYPAGSGCIAWGPQGQRVAFAGQDRRVHLLDLESKQRLWSSSVGHVGEIDALAWSGDGCQLASSGKDTTLRIWDARTGTERARLRGHMGAVTALAWNPLGNRLASCASDQTVKIWDMESTDERQEFQGHNGPVSSLSWDATGRHLVASNGTWSSLWDVDRNLEINEYKGQRSALSPTANWLAVAVGPSIRIHNVRSGELVKHLTGHSQGVTSLVWNHDGSRLASASWDGTARIWSVADGETLRTIPLTHKAREICWSPDGTCLAVIGNRDVQIWETESGKQRVPYHGRSQIHAIAWSPQGGLLATGGWDHAVTIWDANTADTVLVLTGHTSPITSLCWNPTGTRLVSGSEDQLVRIWDIGSRGELLSLHGHRAGVTKVAWSRDGLRIATGDSTGKVLVWDASTGHLCARTPQALGIVNRRLQTQPRIGDLAVRADILQGMGRSRAAAEDRRRIRLLSEEQLALLLDDSLSVKLLASRMLADLQAEGASTWTAVEPVEMRASDGATLALQEDKSMFVSGPQTVGVQYDLVVRANSPPFGLRLEAIPDARLPHGGSGRAEENGNFHVAELEVYRMETSDSEHSQKVGIERCCGDSKADLPDARTVSRTIDGNRKTFWDTFPDHKQPHWAIYQFERSSFSGDAPCFLRIRIDSGVSPWGPHGLGRFRVSFTDRVDVVRREQLLQSMLAHRADSVVVLAKAFALQGESEKAALVFAEALRRAEQESQRGEIVAAVAQYDDLFGKLQDLLPADPWLKLIAADGIAAGGARGQNATLRVEAVDQLLLRAAESPEDVLQALGEAAVAYSASRRFDEALQVLRPAYARSRELLSEEHSCSLKLLSELAQVVDRLGRYGEARQLMEEEFVARTEAHGSEDPRTVRTGRRLAELRALCGLPAESVALHLRMTELNPFEDLNETQRATFLLAWADDQQSHARLCRRLVDANEEEMSPKVIRDLAKMILLQPSSDKSLRNAAADLAARSAEMTPTNMWSMLSLGMSHFRQRDSVRAEKLLRKAADTPVHRLSLLARTYLAMVRFNEGDREPARQELRQVEASFGLLAYAEVQSPLMLHHDDLAIWLALRESRRVMGLEPRDAHAAVERMVMFQQRQVREAPENTLKALHLAILLSWLGRDAAHNELCQHLLDGARDSASPRRLERAAKAYLAHPAADPALLALAAECAAQAVQQLQDQTDKRRWAELALGMAAYRQQQFGAAITSLTAAIESSEKFVQGPALLYRSMAYWHLNRRDESHADFLAAEGVMRPVPSTRGATEDVLNHDQLVFWLAYDEACMLRSSAQRKSRVKQQVDHCASQCKERDWRNGSEQPSATEHL